MLVSDTVSSVWRNCSAQKSELTLPHLTASPQVQVRRVGHGACLVFDPTTTSLPQTGGGRMVTPPPPFRALE